MRLIDADKLEDSVICSVCFWDDDDEDLILDAISQQPTVDAVPVAHARWLRRTVRGQEGLYCAACMESPGVLYEFDFCPNCGAKMNLEEGENVVPD
jgi:NADH pyrophosphatase NudC (nudix superfamily)